MVDLTKSGEMKSLIGAVTVGKDGKPVIIAQAKFEYQLQMDEFGATAQAAAMAASRGLGPMRAQINGPYIVWFEKEGTVPFASYVDVPDMKRPPKRQ